MNNNAAKRSHDWLWVLVPVLMLLATGVLTLANVAGTVLR